MALKCQPLDYDIPMFNSLWVKKQAIKTPKNKKFGNTDLSNFENDDEVCIPSLFKINVTIVACKLFDQLYNLK